MLYEENYVLPDKILLKVKKDMKNYIRVKEISVLWHGLYCFYKDNPHEKLSKKNHYTSKEKSSREGLAHGCLVYHKGLLHLWIKIGWLIQSYQDKQLPPSKIWKEKISLMIDI